MDVDLTEELLNADDHVDDLEGPHPSVEEPSGDSPNENSPSHSDDLMLVESPAITTKKNPRKRRVIASAAGEPEDPILEVVSEGTISVPVEPRLPVSRVKAFMKLDPRVTLISADAAYLTTKATEMFIHMVAKQAWTVTERAHRKTIQLNDIKHVLETSDMLQFLEDMI